MPKRKSKLNSRRERYGEEFDDMLREARVGKMHEWYQKLVSWVQK